MFPVLKEIKDLLHFIHNECFDWKFEWWRLFPPQQSYFGIVSIRCGAEWYSGPELFSSMYWLYVHPYLI